jgi:hypothetical protein
MAIRFSERDANQKPVDDYNLLYVVARNGCLAAKKAIQMADDPETVVDDLRIAHALSAQDMAIAKLDMKMNQFIFEQIAIEAPDVATFNEISMLADALAHLTNEAATIDAAVVLTGRLLSEFDKIHGA